MHTNKGNMTARVRRQWSLLASPSQCGFTCFCRDEGARSVSTEGKVGADQAQATK